MPPLLRHFFAWTALLAFALGAKIHLPLAQAAGWARMTANYARLMPLEDAVETALSGRELCGVCEYVRNAEHTRRATDELFAQSAGVTGLLAPAPDAARAVAVFVAPEKPEWAIPSDLFAEPRDGLPETPPPRAAV